ncbi:hypothetical protein HY500_02385 [Candidatus Woesearchaeota archaeon]|nr:hypothetical protein [Candidatus Woesearchaeota archaeon]
MKEEEKRIDVLEVLAMGAASGVDDPRRGLIGHAERLSKRIPAFNPSELPEYQKVLDALVEYRQAVIRKLVEIQEGGYTL